MGNPEIYKPKKVVYKIVSPPPIDFKAKAEKAEREILALQVKVEKLSHSLLGCMRTVSYLYGMERNRAGSLVRPDFKELINIQEDLFSAEQN